MSLGKAFLVALLVGAAVMVAMAYVPTAPRPTAPGTAASAMPAVLARNIHVRDQLRLADVDGLGGKGYRTLIDLRPDGEAPDQPSSATVAQAAAGAGLKFIYVPTPNGAIPDTVVADLTKALDGVEGPVLLYCRSGSRAARVWALAEASRPGGGDAAAITHAVKAAGQKVDDLLPRITARIAARPGSQ